MGSSTHWETRGVLAGAYASRRPKSLLTHSVEVDARGDELRVYCGRVAIENVADRYGGDVDARPTCPRCAKHFDTLHGGLREDPSSAAIEFVRRQPEPPGWSGDVAIGIPFDSRAVSYTFRGRREDLPLRAVPIDQLVATQPTVDKGAIIRLLSGELDGSPPILVLAVGDRFWIQDGHHRAYAAMLLGRETVEAYIRPPVTSSVREVRERDSSLYEDGIPTVITAYHGTDSGPFTQFDPARRGSATDDGLLGAGFYASTDPQVGRSSKTTLELSVRFERPLRIEFPSWSADKSRLVNNALGTHGLRGTAITVEAERQGYDGVVLDYSPVGYRHQEVVAFDRDQIQILGPVAVRPLVTEGLNELCDGGDDSWEDYLAPGEARYVPAVVLPQMPDVVARAAAAGMPQGAEFMGAGMTGAVFCVGAVAYKVARQASPTLRRMLEEEAEWLAAAANVPTVAPHVAGVRWFDPGNVVIVRDCPRADPDEPRWKWESALFDLHRRIEQAMLPNGWTAPEFKPDSYVLTSGGPILVDASMPSRVGNVLARYVEDLVEGVRELSDERPSDLAFAVRREAGQTLPQEEADRLQALLEQRWPGTAS